MTSVAPTARVRATARVRLFALDWWRRFRALPVVVIILLVFGVWIASGLVFGAPTFGLDGSWVNGINVASLDGKQFGKDIDFTVGPWAAYLDLGSILSLRFLLPALAARIVTGIFLTFLAWKLARRWLTPFPAALVVTLVVVPALSVADQISGRILLLAVMCAIGFRVGAIAARWHSGVTVVLAILAALAILVKFSNGTLAIGTVVLVAALCGNGSVLRRGLSALVTLAIVAVSIVAFWLLAGQNLANLAPWFSSSLQLTSGYSEAMATEDPALLYQYPLLLVLVGVLVALACLRRGSSRIILLVFVAWVSFAALRLGFTRHDLGHTWQSFALLVVACLGLGLTRYIWLSLSMVIISAVALVPTSAVYFDVVSPISMAAISANDAHAALSKGYRAVLLANASAAGAAQYALPPSVLSAVKGKTVDMDPFDANVAWVYSLNWHPVPVFQTYAAFTSALDKINADALRSPGGPQTVIRSQLATIDMRQAMWESPQYMQALVCDFTPTVSTERWQVVSKSSNRCGEPSRISSQRFEAGQQITVPDAPGPGYMVVAHFTLDNSPLNWVATELFKPISTVTVSTDQGPFRLPRAHAGGPLILTLPATAGWPVGFGGNTHMSTLNLNESGSVVFSAISVSDGS